MARYARRARGHTGSSRWRVVALLAMVSAGCTPGPAPIAIDRVVELSSNQGHTCAVRADGTVWCWGVNHFGQLGTGTLADSRGAAVPVDGVAGATGVSAGRDFTCAAQRDGRAQCWGYNLSGQAGDGSVFNLALPSEVAEVDHVRAVAAGHDHACAVTTDGTVSCWGRNWLGQVGDGTLENRPVAVRVSGIRDIEAITSGDSFSCALDVAGRVWCWGINGQGQLGDGTTDDRTMPVQVVGLPRATAISAGLAHTCAIVGRGAVWCWGSPTAGQLGIAHDADGSRPVEVRGTGRAVAIATGDATACVAGTDGSVRCWGGDAPRTRAQPERVALPVGRDRPTSIEVVGSHACVVRSTGQLACGDR